MDHHNPYARFSLFELHEQATYARSMAHIADKDGSGNPSTAYDRWAKEWARLRAEIKRRPQEVRRPEVTDEQFRLAGFTPAARNYLRTERGFLWLCKFNGVPPEIAPKAWRYASNPYMWEYVEGKAKDELQLKSDGT